MLFLLGRGRMEPAFRRRIRDRALAPYVTLAHPSGDVSHAMHSADIFVRPKSHTAFSANSLLAMAAGMAVVSFPDRICDHLRDGETAVICHEPTPEALAGAIERLLNDRAGARRMATAGAEYVRTHHAVSEMAQRTSDAYRQLALARATFSIKE